MKTHLASRRNRFTGALALAIAVALCAVMATVASAANLKGDGTIIGTTGADNITAGNGNDTIWGLGNYDNINAGNGNDVIDAGGYCPPGVASGVYPNGYPASSYCEHGPYGVQGDDNIDIGSGNDIVYGNWGLNTLNANGGSDTFYGYGEWGNNVSLGGNGNDTVYAYYPGNYDLNGDGTNKVYDNYTPGSVVNCGSKKTTVYAVKGWSGSISTNCTVVYESPATPPRDPSLKRHAPAKAKRHATHKAKRHATHKAKRHVKVGRK